VEDRPGNAPGVVGEADLFLRDAEGVHPAFHEVFEDVGVRVGELAGVRHRVGGNLPRRGRCADHGGRFLEEAAESTLEAIEESGHAGSFGGAGGGSRRSVAHRKAGSHRPSKTERP
jgi:hypothetical protein